MTDASPLTPSLGANCLAALFLRDHPVLDAHRAALDAVAAAGFGVTEISHPRLFPVQEAPLLRRHAEEIGLVIRAVHAPPMRRDPTLGRQRHAAALAAELGAAILVVHVSSLRFASADPAARARARERDLSRLESLAASCAPLGLTLGLENGKHPRHAEYLLSLLQALEGSAGAGEAAPPDPSITSSPHHPPALRVPVTSSVPAGLVFDSGHAALRGGDPLPVARAMLPRLVHTHLHDNRGARDDHLTPGDGLIDWPALLSLLQEGGYTRARLLELQPRPGWSPEHWQRELAKGWNLLSGKLDSDPL
jgi:sugar phosphate isomerase/epimerase